MSLLNKAIQEKNREPQLAAVSFDTKGAGWVMWYRGDALEGDIDAVGTSADDLGITDSNSPDHGIWIWEGHFYYWQDYEGECDVDVRTKEWRKPNAAEWHAIMSGRDPFDLYYFMRPEGKKITVIKPNANDDVYIQKEMVSESWMKRGSTFHMLDKDQVRAKLIAMDRGRALECPKCKGRVEGKHCTGCGYFCG